MITRKTNIRHWEILFLFSFDTADMESIYDALVWAEAPDSVFHEVSENVSSGRLNEGFTFSNPSLRRSVLAAGKAASGPEMLNTIVHEIVHVAQHISEEDGLDTRDERFAYLCGDISSSVCRTVCTLSCPRCGGD